MFIAGIIQSKHS